MSAVATVRSYLARRDARVRPPVLDRSVSPRAFQELFSASGVVLISNFLSRSNTCALKQLVSAVYTIVADEINRDVEQLDPALVANFSGWHGIMISGLELFLNENHQDLHKTLIDIRHDVQNHLRHLFGFSWQFCPRHSFMRRHFDKTYYGGWHIDADAARLANAGAQCINVWLPLDMVGRRMPSLEFVVASQGRMRSVGLMSFDQPTAFRADEWVALIPGDRWVPLASPGDAVIFDQYTLHRTEPRPLRDRQRSSCEFRFTIG
jgi:hypothetical protein